MFSKKFELLLSMSETYKDCFWRASIYENFTSNGVKDFDVIYDDIITLNEKSFEAKWFPFYLGSGFTTWFACTREKLSKWQEAVSYLQYCEKVFSRQDLDDVLVPFRVCVGCGNIEFAGSTCPSCGQQGEFRGSLCLDDFNQLLAERRDYSERWTSS